MPDHEKPNARGLFGGVFARGGVEAGDAAWLRAMLDAEAQTDLCRKAVDGGLKESRLKVAATRDQALQVAKQKQNKAMGDAEASRDERLRLINEVFAKKTVEVQTKLAQEMREAVDVYEKIKVELPSKYEATSKKLDGKYHALKEEIRARHESAWSSMAAR